MNLKCQMTRLWWAAALAMVCGLPCAGCGESGGAQPVVQQTEEQKAQQASAEKATAEAFNAQQQAAKGAKHR